MRQRQRHQYQTLTTTTGGWLHTWVAPPVSRWAVMTELVLSEEDVPIPPCTMTLHMQQRQSFETDHHSRCSTTHLDSTLVLQVGGHDLNDVNISLKRTPSLSSAHDAVRSIGSLSIRTDPPLQVWHCTPGQGQLLPPGGQSHLNYPKIHPLQLLQSENVTLHFCDRHGSEII